MLNYFDFENGIEDIDQKINDLKRFSDEKKIDLSNEVENLYKQKKDKLSEIYSKLTPWQKFQVSRHIQRPYTKDYISNIFNDFVELHGDRKFKNDPAIVGGLAKLDNKNIMVIGVQKGRDIKENLHRNFGMPSPEGYRKALRLMKLAERFNVPIITFVDVKGAYPGIGAEERGQGEAIARNLLEMAGLTVPVVAIIIGEGGSGGALGLSVANKIFMLENSWFSVISPEGAAAILFNDSKKSEFTASALKIDADSLMEIGIIDGIIKEPLGGAHRDYKQVAENVKEVIVGELEKLCQKSKEELKEEKYQKFRSFGEYQE